MELRIECVAFVKQRSGRFFGDFSPLRFASAEMLF